MGRVSCDEVRELAPELALGLADGADRADALAHLADCLECRRAVDELAHVADSLLCLGPRAEPPTGFETWVTARLTPRRHRWVGVVAAVVVAAGLLGGMLSRGLEPARPVTRSFALSALPDGRQRTGDVYTVEADQPWLLVSVSAPTPDGSFRCVADVEDGRLVELGNVIVAGGHGSWGGPSPLPPRRIRAVRMISTTGATVATAMLKTRRAADGSDRR